MKYRDIGFVKEDFLHVLPNSVKYRLTFHKCSYMLEVGWDL